MTTRRDLAWTTFIARLRQDFRSDVVYWRQEKGQTVLTASEGEFVVTDADLFERRWQADTPSIAT